MKKLIDLFRAPKKLSDSSPNWNQKSEESIFNKITDDQFNRMCENNGWDKIPTYEDYYEPPTQEEVIAALEHFVENQQDYPEEFKKTFKKRFRDILA